MGDVKSDWCRSPPARLTDVQRPRLVGVESAPTGFGVEAAWGFVERLIGEIEGAEMHADDPLCVHVPAAFARS